MAREDAILGRNVANPTTLDTSILAGPSGVTGFESATTPGNIESTLDIDPGALTDSNSLVSRFDAGGDVDLAQPRIKPEVKRDAANERAAAVGGVAGTALVEAVSIWSNVETLKAEDKIFMEKIQRGHETLEFNQRMVRNAGNMSALNASLNAIDSLNKQGGNVAAGGQEQLFLRSPNSGRIV